jgi:hypothetical protein
MTGGRQTQARLLCHALSDSLGTSVRIRFKKLQENSERTWLDLEKQLPEDTSISCTNDRPEIPDIVLM